MMLKEMQEKGIIDFYVVADHLIKINDAFFLHLLQLPWLRTETSGYADDGHGHWLALSGFVFKRCRQAKRFTDLNLFSCQFCFKVHYTFFGTFWQCGAVGNVHGIRQGLLAIFKTNFNFLLAWLHKLFKTIDSYIVAFAFCVIFLSNYITINQHLNRS